MSQSGRLANYAAMELARRKLDDLDSLIQRMLDLPVIESDREVEQLVPTVHLEQQTTPPVLPCAIEVRDEREEHGLRPWEDFPPLAVVPAVEKRAVAAPAEQRATRREASRPTWWLVPLVLLNWLFDVATHWLGPLGRWLRGNQGRRLLGWVGVASVIAALLAALLDGMGWLPR